MNSTPFHQFIDLVRCDDQINSCLRTQERFKKDLVTLNQEKKAYQLACEQVQNNAKAIKKELDAKELELSAARQKKISIEKKLTTVANAREYESLQHEQAALDAKIETLEQQIMQLWEPYEQAKTAVLKQDQQCVEKITALVEQENKIHEQCHTLDETINFLRRDRSNKVAFVRPEWLERYDALRQSVQNPVVIVQSGACSGCFNQITPQLNIRVQRHELVTCPMCRRILYQV